MLITRFPVESEWEGAPSQGPDDGDKFVPGDEALESAIFSMRDGLVMRLYNEAIKSGDSGCAVTVLKPWVLAFRGSGRTKRAYEMLHLIHNLAYVWPTIEYAGLESLWDIR